MSDELHRAVRAELDAHEPGPAPSFDSILDRKRSRDRRRGGAVLVGTALAVAGIVFVPTALSGGAGTAPGQAAGPKASTVFGYSVTVSGGAAASGTSEEALDRCLQLPGLSDGVSLDSDPAQYRGVVTGEEQADAFESCVEAVPGRAVTITPRVAPPDSGLPVDPAETRAEPATWEIDPDRPPRAGSRTFQALVRRLGCASGETGEVLTPATRQTSDRVDVTFAVAAREAGAAFCTMNNSVPSTVELDAPLGSRLLVDGTCAEAPARTTSPCLTAQRWPTTDRASEPTTLPDAEARQLVVELRAFAARPSSTTADTLRFASTVRLGLGRELGRPIAARQLRDREAWAVPTSAGYDGIADPTVNALDLLDEGEPHTAVVGPHPHCAGPARPAPDGLAAARRVSTQPSGSASCNAWYTVDVFLRDGKIEAVTLDLWQP